MGQSDGNFVVGTITTTTRMRSHETVTLPLTPSPANPLEVNRFEGGRIVINGRSYPVTCNLANGDTCNTASSVTVNNPFGQLFTFFAGTQFQLYDDDDFNDNNGTLMDGDTGEDILGPDEILPTSGMSLLTAGSDLESTNVFAPAYVRPVYDIVNSRNNCVFQANELSDNAVDLRPLFTQCWDSSSTNTDPQFWSVLVFGAYQHTTAEDGDPSNEPDGTTYGIVDAITTVSGGINNDREGSGASIFMEVHRPRETPTYNSNPQDVTSLSNTVAHEVAHLFSCEHGEGELMGDILPDGSLNITSSHFSPASIRKIRVLMHP